MRVAHGAVKSGGSVGQLDPELGCRTPDPRDSARGDARRIGEVSLDTPLTEERLGGNLLAEVSREGHRARVW